MTAARDPGEELDRRVAVLLGGLCLLALVVDVVWLARLPTPAATPSLLLVLVVASGLLGGPAAGAIAGLSAGLVVDLSPPTALLTGTGAAGLAVAGALAGAAVRRRRRPGPHPPRPWVRTGADAGVTALAALAAGATSAAALAVVRAVAEPPGADTPPADVVLPQIAAGAAYAAIVALIVLPVVRTAARHLLAR